MEILCQVQTNLTNFMELPKQKCQSRDHITLENLKFFLIIAESSTYSYNAAQLGTQEFANLVKHQEPYVTAKQRIFAICQCTNKRNH